MNEVYAEVWGDREVGTSVSFLFLVCCSYVIPRNAKTQRSSLSILLPIL